MTDDEESENDVTPPTLEEIEALCDYIDMELEKIDETNATLDGLNEIREKLTEIEKKTSKN